MNTQKRHPNINENHLPSLFLNSVLCTFNNSQNIKSMISYNQFTAIEVHMQYGSESSPNWRQSKPN